MKLHFSKKESIYTVFKTIKKIPAYKTVALSFDPDHPLFEHVWRGTQLKELIQQHDLQVIITVTSGSMKQFFEQQGLTTVFKHKHIFQKIGQHIHTFIFSTQQFHTNLIFKNSYISYLVILSEVVVLSFILYLFWGLISPNAVINIQPARHIETIVYKYAYTPGPGSQHIMTGTTIGKNALRIPYYEGSIPFNHRLTLNVENIEFSTTNAVGTIEFINTTDQPIDLLTQTTLINANDLLFKTDEKISIPAGTPENPGKNTITVTAEAFTEKGSLIGEEGNLPKDSILRIKNLPESMEQKSMYAVVKYGFSGGSTVAKGSVIANDIDTIEEKIITYMEEKKKETLQNSIIEKDTFILLYNEFITLVVDEFITTSHVGDTTSFIEGEIKAHITYRYVKQSDITQVVDTYIKQRTSQNFTLLNYDFNSLTFYDISKKTDDGTLFIPTKINAIRGYNFEDDMNSLVPEMKAKIVGKKAAEVKKMLLQYPEIDDVTISISPPWYDTLPDVTSRVTFRVLHD